MTPKQILAWRLRHDLTQDQAARLVGVHARSWQKWELGERAVPPPVTRLLLACERFPGVREMLDRMGGLS